MESGCEIKRLLSNSALMNLTQDYCLIGQGEIPVLVRLLQAIRYFQKDLMIFEKLQPLITQICEIDQAISQEIIELRRKENSIDPIDDMLLEL